MGRGRVPGVPPGPPRRRTARGAAAPPTVLPGPRAARHREGARGPRRAWGRGDARHRRERPAPRPGDRAGASLGPPARDARRRAGASRHERRLPARALGRVVGVPSAPGASGGRHARGHVAPAGAARTDGRRRRGGSCAQGPRRAVLARPGRGARAGPARGRSEPADELRAEPRKLGGRSPGRARVGARGVGFTADRRARGAGRRSRGGGGPVSRVSAMRRERRSVAADLSSSSSTASASPGPWPAPTAGPCVAAGAVGWRFSTTARRARSRAGCAVGGSRRPASAPAVVDGGSSRSAGERSDWRQRRGGRSPRPG